MEKKKELTPEQAILMEKLAEHLRSNPGTADRFEEYLEHNALLESVVAEIDPKKFYKPSYVVNLLQISRQTLYNMVKNKQLKPIKVGTYQKFIGQELINYLNKEYEI